MGVIYTFRGRAGAGVTRDIRVSALPSLIFSWYL